MRRTSRLLSLRLASTPSPSTRHLSSVARPIFSAHRIQSQPVRRRLFHASSSTLKGLSPSHEEPEPPKTEAGSSHVAEPAKLTTDEYHDIADQYIDTLVLKLEEMAEDASEKMEVEYSVSSHS